MSRSEVKKVEMQLFNTTQSFAAWEEGPYWTRVQAKLMQRVKLSAMRANGVLLEVGCGKSVFLPLVGDSNLELVGSDISIGFLKLNTGCERVLADAENLPIKDSSVGYLLCIGVIHHAPNKPMMVAEMSRVVRNGGRVFIMEPHSKSLNYVYWIIRRLLIRLLGWGKVFSLIGFGTPYESFVSKKLVTANLKHFALSTSYYSPLRGIPFRAFRRLGAVSGQINDFLEKLPLIRTFGTYIVFEGQKQ